MVVVNVQPNGQAPQGLSPGDFVNTAGGMYQIADPGTYGAVYNPESGYWSYKMDSDEYRIMSLINSAKTSAEQNTMQSQDFAREQMAFQNNSAEKAMQFSAEQAAMNRDWQERLSNSAHQREVKDLIAAGLNPILSAHGQGATTPSGASAAGVSASGASGSVDTGGTAAASQLLATMLNNQISLDIAKLQTAATMYAADKGYSGSLAAAGATLGASANSAAAARYGADLSYSAIQDQIAWQKEQASNYPTTIPQAAAGIIKGITDALGQNNSGGTIAATVQNLLKNINIFKRHKAS